MKLSFIPFKTVRNKIMFLITIGSILVLSSCSELLTSIEEDEIPEIHIETEMVSYSYIHFKQSSSGMENAGGDSRLYYDTIPVNEFSSYISTSIDYTVYPRISGLKPNTKYYIRVSHNLTWSDPLTVTTLNADLNCVLTAGEITGDLNANQHPFYDLNTVSNGFEGIFGGDFTTIKIRLPQQSYSGGFDDGVYTTISNIENYGYVYDILDATFTINGSGSDPDYHAKGNQPLHIYKPYSYSSFQYVEFCNMVFETEDGDVIVLSGKLK